ncbi:two component transcriptional regulator, LytTR family [Flavobacterium micromati]|jgi:two-component system LytT family response regulator|uniref:Two component transcriptional regulator, LytTR family n=1 Tax=Flavobacterium micromati TaxID=229205 RepID=A0A1M5HYW7_9FLAO|nr:LytTR family DNA-binding domain-containing protein [Flavobacterium micromati]MCL6462685.1 response regulator transcription factor [Flavobacterium micromati]SHG21208.1 two component transcriptional regulator, LytTR family [Flavobacterium micromati]
MKIKVIIVDDELHARSFLRKFCERYYNESIEVLDECNSVESAVRSIKKNQPDLVFLDIAMPDENGFELLKYFDKINFEIIFTTAYKEFAIQAIRNSALDYLVKPINNEDFQVAISRFEFKKDTKIDFDRFKLLTDNINNQFVDKQRIVFPTKNGFEVIQANTIVYCKSDGSYTSIHTIEKEHFTSKTFKEVCEILVESHYIKVHRSFLINKNYIKGFKTDDYNLEMITGHIIPVSDALFTKKKLIDAITN